ncbi:MAG: hypothetical protein IPM69_13005 [Ignavibacteria bacterium]|nr:hypothetical protein [Ignavibacteria bacterium]
MNKSIILCLISACFVFFTEASSQSLKVQDVRQTWRQDNGSIDSAVMTVKPVGAYFEYGLYLTLSAKGTSLTNVSDTLEIQYSFDLISNSMMIDSWLWVEDTIVKAMLIDKGQATQIYEGIVNRRKDPSILTKVSSTRYDFKIFPLAGSSSRKVKISWLQPAHWSVKNVSAQLPTNLLLGSRTPLKNFRIIALEDSKWSNPSLSIQGYTLNDVIDPFYGNGKEIILKQSSFSSMPFIQFTSPLQNGFFLQCFEDSKDEGYYQLVMLTKQAIDVSTQKKTLFILDYDISQTTLTKKEVLSELQTALLANYSAKDSFNILLSNGDAQPIFNQWVSASSTSINEAFAGINEDQLSPYSYLQLSLPNGLQFMKDHGNSANVIVISNSDGLGNYKLANPLIQEIASISNLSAQINCIDYSTTRRSYYQNSMSYYGNSYLYDYLTKWSGGFYLDANSPKTSLSIAISSIINSAEGSVQSLELYTTLEDGFCYGRFDKSFSQAQRDAGIVFQIGRYYGKLPIKVRATGFYHDKPFSKEVSFAVTPEIDSFLMTRRIWNGNYISSLETSSVTNEMIKEIIDVSRRNRVLSLYTAFLALEPWLMPKDNYYFYQPEKKEGGGINTSIENESFIFNSNTVQIKAFPNPFTSSIQLEFSELAPGVAVTGVEIYNSIGVLVKTFDGNVLYGKQLVWNGDDNNGTDVASGMYSVVVRTSKGSIRFNILLNR